MDNSLIYVSSYTAEVYNKNGILFCSGQFGSNPFCVTKLVQFLLSASILLVIIYDIVQRYRQEKQYTFRSIFFALSIMMILSLICNCSYCLDHKLHAFNFMEGFFYNLYFVTIVFYVAYKLITVVDIKQNSRKVYLWVLNAAYGVSIGFLISVLVEKFIKIQSSCSELWYLVVTGFCILLSVLLTAVGASYTRKQIQKLSGIENPKNYKNPLPNIWIWISFNIFSQVCSFIQSLIFQLTPDSKCTFSSNFGTDQGIKLLFVILSFQVGMVSTIIFFRNKYKREKQNEQYDKNGNSTTRASHGRRASVNIQLIEQFSIH